MTSFITGNQFKTLANHVFDEDTLNDCFDCNKKYDVVFLKTDYITNFKRQILPTINYKFKLITHNSDYASPFSHLDLLEHPNLIMWYGMNANLAHPKFQPIPIGIANEKYEHGNKIILQNIIDLNNTKNNLIYCNFNLSTTSFRYEIYNKLKHYNFIDFDMLKKHSFSDYLNILSTYKYAISPRGNSIDCHRIWECIYLGVIPICEKAFALDFFKDLPILFVDNYEKLNKSLLEDEYSKLLCKNKEKAYFDYYKKLIKQ